MSSSWGLASNPPGVGGPNRAAVTSGTPLCPLSCNGRVLPPANAPAHLQIDLQISGQQNRQVALDKKDKQEGERIPARPIGS